MKISQEDKKILKEAYEILRWKTSALEAKVENFRRQQAELEWLHQAVTALEAFITLNRTVEEAPEDLSISINIFKDIDGDNLEFNLQVMREALDDLTSLEPSRRIREVEREIETARQVRDGLAALLESAEVTPQLTEVGGVSFRTVRSVVVMP